MRPEWCVLVPQKSLAHAKQRLRVPPNLRRALAGAFLVDTLTAITSAEGVARVVVVWDTDTLPPVAGVEGWPARGVELNAALRRDADHVRRSDPELGIAVVPADLPGLDPGELTTGLIRASGFPGAFLPDRAGTGTTLLTAAAGGRLAPHYGPDSADAHRRAGLHELSGAGLDTVRQDVDELSDLARVLPTIGRRTRAVCAGIGRDVIQSGCSSDQCA